MKIVSVIHLWLEHEKAGSQQLLNTSQTCDW